jgi:hypothetical protein
LLHDRGVRSVYVLLFVIAAAGCDQSTNDAGKETPTNCHHFATDPSSGMCWSFGEACAPPEWTSCAGCTKDSDCPSGEQCQLTQTATDATIAPGMCTPNGAFAPDGGMTFPPPNVNAGCASNASCQVGEICPAQFGRCSPDRTPQAGLICPSQCETACFDDTTCAATERCNAIDLCAMANVPMDSADPTRCAGWCVAR